MLSAVAVRMSPLASTRDFRMAAFARSYALLTLFGVAAVVVLVLAVGL